MSRRPCETCRYFELGGEKSGTWGMCRLTLPRWVSEHPEIRRDVHVSDTCDLHKPKEVKP